MRGRAPACPHQHHPYTPPYVSIRQHTHAEAVGTDVEGAAIEVEVGGIKSSGNALAHRRRRINLFEVLAPYLG